MEFYRFESIWQSRCCCCFINLRLAEAAQQ